MKRHFLMMANYNRWANATLYEMAAELPDELYRKDVGVFFKSLHGTLNHLLTTDPIWMRRLDGTGGHPDKLNAIVFDDLPSLHGVRQPRMNESLTSWMAWQKRTLIKSGTTQRLREDRFASP